MLKFDSRNAQFKSPFGAVATDRRVQLFFPVHNSLKATGVLFVLRGKEEKKLNMTLVGNDGEYDKYSLDFSVPVAGVYYYRFEIVTDNGYLFVGRGEGGKAVMGDWLPEWQLTVFDKSYTTPEWLKGGVIYQIFPDRFYRVEDGVRPVKGPFKAWDEELTIIDPDGLYRANDFYGGNALGVMEKLPYLKELGVTAIYFCPIFKSFSNHRYDTADYTQIDPLFGSEEDFKELIERAKEYGIGIILDGVFNHTGADSIYFNKFGTFEEKGAYQSKDSRYYDWFTFTEFPDEYDCWWGITVVPTVSRNAREFQDFIAGEGGIIDKWTKFGVKGWRLDVVDELSTPFVRALRKAVKRNSDEVAIIGEVWEDASTKESYGEKRSYFFGEELDAVMNYPFRTAIIDLIKNKDTKAFKEDVLTIMENYPKQSLDCCMSLVGTHDTVRIINELAEVVTPPTKAERLAFRLTKEEYEKGIRRVKMASALQFFLPGVPSVYYGDEIGMQGFEDPINRHTFNWDNINEELLKHYQNLGALRKEFGKEETIISVTDDAVKVHRGGYELTVNVKEESLQIEKK